MKILVTGGSGFIGTRLVDLLLAQNHEVVIFDKVKSDKYPELSTVADVRCVDSLINAAKGMDCIYNLAAEHADNVSPISLYYDVNVQGAVNVIKAAEENSLKNIIFTSSVAIYGLDRGSPNESIDAQPFNDYGHSKYQAELEFNKWFEADKSRTLTIVRPAVVFGEENRGNVYNLISQIVSGRFMMVGSGDNCKSMGYVGNVACFLSEQINNISGHKVFNYADKPDLSATEIVSIVKSEMEITGKSLTLPYSLGLLGGYTFDLLSKVTGKKFPVSSVRIRKFCADTTIDASAAMDSGFKPPYSLEEGLKAMIKHEFK